METISSKRVNMALKLEMWLSSKQTSKSQQHHAPPLRPVVFKSDQRRVSGYYNKATSATAGSAAVSAPAASPVTVAASVASPSPTTAVAVGATSLSSSQTKKTFSRLKASASMEALQQQNAAAAAAASSTTKAAASPAAMVKSPSLAFGKNGPPTLPLNHVKSPAAATSAITVDEGAKENSVPGRSASSSSSGSGNGMPPPVSASSPSSSSFDMEFANVEIRGKSKSDRRKSMMLVIDVENIPRADPLVAASAGSPVDPNEAFQAPTDPVNATTAATSNSTNFSFGVHGLSAADVEALIRRNQELEHRAEEAEAHAANLQEELNAMLFLNSVQEQQIGELHNVVSRERLELNETLSGRVRKHRAEVKRLNAERASYEERANQMVAQMGEQMALLQQMAMGRIETLEGDLMAERHRAETLQQEVGSLRMQARIHQQQQRQQKGRAEDDEDEEEEEDEEAEGEDEVAEEGEEDEEEEEDGHSCGDDVDESSDSLPAKEVLGGGGVSEEKEMLAVMA